MHLLFSFLFLALRSAVVSAFQVCTPISACTSSSIITNQNTIPSENTRTTKFNRNVSRTLLNAISSNPDDGEVLPVDPNTLMDMDIVLYKTDATNHKLCLGAIQEDSTLAPLSAWTLENAFYTDENPVIEFVVDEEDRWNPDLEIQYEENGAPSVSSLQIVQVLEEPFVSYGSRQVGGGKGLGNPHGEESELVYYVDRTLLEERGVEIVLKPELEILW